MFRGKKDNPQADRSTDIGPRSSELSTGRNGNGPPSGNNVGDDAEDEDEE